MKTLFIMLIIIGLSSIAFVSYESFSNEDIADYENSPIATLGVTESDYKRLRNMHEEMVLDEHEDTTMYGVLGTVYSNGGEYNKAIDTFDKCIDIDKTDFICYWGIFESQLILGQPIDRLLFQQFKTEVINAEDGDELSDDDYDLFVQKHVDTVLLFEKVVNSNNALTENDKATFEEKYTEFVSEHEYFTEMYWLNIEHWVNNQTDNHNLLDALSFFKSLEAT